MLILEEYWERNAELRGVPIYQASGLARRALTVFQTYIEMMNADIKAAFDQVRCRGVMLMQLVGSMPACFAASCCMQSMFCLCGGGMISSRPRQAGTPAGNGARSLPGVCRVAHAGKGFTGAGPACETSACA